MKPLFSAMSTRWQRLLCVAGWGVFVVLFFASLPFLFDVISRGFGWILGLIPRPDNLWKEYPWCF